MPDTITSPEQQNVLRLLNLQPSVQEQQEQQQNPLISLPPITSAFMQSLTNSRSEAAAKDEAEKSVNVPTPSVTTTTRVDPKTGHIIHDQHVTNMVVGNAQDNVQNAYDKPQEDLKSELAPYMQGVAAVPTGAEVAAKLNSFYGRRQLAMIAGDGPISGTVRAILANRSDANRTALGNQAIRARVDQNVAAAKEALPLIQESDRQRTISRQVGKENADILSKVPFYSSDPSQDLELGAQAIGKSPEELTTREKAGIANAATNNRVAFEKVRTKTAAEAIDKTSLADASGIQKPEDILDYVKAKAQTVPGGMTAEEQGLLQKKLTGLNTEYQQMSDQRKQHLRNEQIQAQAQEANVELLRRQIDAGSPAAVKTAADMIEKNPDYAEHVKETSKNPDFIQNVSKELDSRGINFPHKPPAQDQERLTTIATGRDLLDQMDALARDVKTKTGRDLTGPAVGLASATDNAIGKPAVTQALLSGLSKDQRKTFIDATKKYNVLAGQLFFQEAKNASGRFPVAVTDILHQTTPSIFKSGAINEGTMQGVRAAFDAGERAIQNSRYDGRPPKGAGGTTEAAPIVQRSKSSGAYRYSTDGGKTWQPGQPK